MENQRAPPMSEAQAVRCRKYSAVTNGSLEIMLETRNPVLSNETLRRQENRGSRFLVVRLLWLFSPENIVWQGFFEKKSREQNQQLFRC